MNIVTAIITYSLSLFYGSLALLFTSIRWLWSGASLSFWKLNTHSQRPAVLDSDELGSHKFVQLKDVKLHYVEKGDRSNKLMLCLHGFPEFWYSWRHQLREFGSDYWVVAVDMRGYGDSDKPSGVNNYHINTLVDDVQQIIQALGRESCILVGHDWGGAIAWQFAMDYPQMVDKLIELNIPHPFTFVKTLKKSVKQFLLSWYIFFFQLPFLPELVIRCGDFMCLREMWKDHVCKEFYIEEDVDAYIYACSQPGAMTPQINYYRAIDFGAKMKNIAPMTMPTLLVWGDKDLALSTAMAEASSEYVSDFTLRIVEGASHFVNQDQPDVVNQHMRKFLEK